MTESVKRAKLIFNDEENVEESKIEVKENEPCNPLSLPPEIWTKIFKSMEKLDTLKSVRLVSKLWNNLVVPIFIKRSQVRVRFCDDQSRHCSVGLENSSLNSFVKAALAARARGPDLDHPFKNFSLTVDGGHSLRDHMDSIWEFQKLSAFTTVTSVRLKQFPLSNFDPDLEILVSLVGMFGAVENFQVDRLHLNEKDNITDFIAFLDRLPLLRDLNCVLVMQSSSPFFTSGNQSPIWDSGVINGFSRFTRLKQLKLGFTPDDVVLLHEENEEPLNVDEKIRSVGQRIQNALIAQNSKVHFVCTNETRYRGYIDVASNYYGQFFSDDSEDSYDSNEDENLFSGTAPQGPFDLRANFGNENITQGQQINSDDEEASQESHHFSSDSSETDSFQDDGSDFHDVIFEEDSIVNSSDSDDYEDEDDEG